MESALKCDICGRSVWKEKSELLMRCSVCGLIRAKMNPSEGQLRDVYGYDYFFGGEYIDYLQDRVALEKNFSMRMKNLMKYLNSESSLIEIGCSYGFFLNICRKFVKKCIGYDITKEGIEYASKELGLEVYCDSFLNYRGEKADFVCLWDVVEHLSEPDKFIEKIASSVKDGGYVALSTGDSGSLLARLRGDRWRMVHPPTHLFYFDKLSISKLLKKHGFEIIEFKHSTVYRNVDSVFQQLIHWQGKKPSTFFTFLYKICKKLGLTKINFGINLFDIMDVVAVKRLVADSQQIV